MVTFILCICAGQTCNGLHGQGLVVKEHVYKCTLYEYLSNDGKSIAWCRICGSMSGLHQNVLPQMQCRASDLAHAYGSLIDACFCCILMLMRTCRSVYRRVHCCVHIAFY